jgi:hypothetical protein
VIREPASTLLWRVPKVVSAVGRECKAQQPRARTCVRPRGPRNRRAGKVLPAELDPVHERHGQIGDRKAEERASKALFPVDHRH